MADEEVPVLIVGGSLVGLTTAMLLGHHGVPSLSVERHAGTAIHPRAGHFQLRTMELMRERGLELGATVRNRTEAVALEQDDDGVTVTLRDIDSGDEQDVRAGYVVAAD